MKMKFCNYIRCMIFFMMILLCMGCGRQESANVKADESTAQAGNTEDMSMAEQGSEKPEAEFPIVLEDGKLTIESVFQSNIPNPDKGFEEGVDVASIELVNQSGEYLKKADIRITLEDGTNLVFQVYDIPAGKTVWAFDTANTAIAVEHPYQEVQCEAEFDETYTGWEGKFQVTAEAATAEITNLTDREQTDVKVIFHCVMEGVYFGGTSYEYRIEELSQQESTELEVIECYFGDSEVVQIEY